MGSTRLPGKVLAGLANHNVLYYVIRRCQQSRRVKGIVIATTEDSNDDPVVSFAKDLGIDVFRGSENDVLSRYAEAAVQVKADPVIRITSDCPLIEPAIIDKMVALYAKTHVDYARTNGYPRGTGDVEIVNLSSLLCALKETRPEDTYYREHVTTYFLDHPDKFKLNIHEAPVKFKRTDLRLCVDEQADLNAVRRITEHFAPREEFKLEEVIDFLDKYPEIGNINRHVKQKIG